MIASDWLKKPSHKVKKLRNSRKKRSTMTSYNEDWMHFVKKKIATPIFLTSEISIVSGI